MIRQKINNNRANPDNWREISLRKAQTRITREHKNNMITDVVPKEEHDVKPEEAEPLVRGLNEFKDARIVMGTFGSCL